MARLITRRWFQSCSEGPENIHHTPLDVVWDHLAALYGTPMLQPSGRTNKHNGFAVVTIHMAKDELSHIDPRRLDTNLMGNHHLSHSERLQAWDRNKPKQGKKTPTQVLGTKHVRQEESKGSVYIEVPHNAPEMQFA